MTTEIILQILSGKGFSSLLGSLLVKKYVFRNALQSEMACFAFKRLYEQHETACESETLDELLCWLFYGSHCCVSSGLHE